MLNPPLAFFVLLFIFGPAVAFGYAILQPLAKAVRGKRGTWKFFISDFFALTFLLAIPLVFVASMRRRQGRDAIPTDVIGFILVAVSGYVWWRGTVALSTVGVRGAGRRCVFLGILLPIAILGSALAVPMLAGMTFAIGRMSASAFAFWLLGAISAPAIAWYCRRAVFWVLSDGNR